MQCSYDSHTSDFVLANISASSARKIFIDTIHNNVTWIAACSLWLSRQHSLMYAPVSNVSLNEQQVIQIFLYTFENESNVLG